MSKPTHHRPELLAPAGDWDCAKAAVANGADAVYFGLDNFNARHRATNFRVEELPQIMSYLHRHNVKGFLTFNTGISRLLAGLGIECEKRLKQLTHTAQRLELPYPLSSSDHYYAKLHAKLREKDADLPHFIGSEDMAIEALTQALVDAEVSRRFYEHLRDASHASPLHSLLATIVRQKRAELGVLGERLTSGEGLTQPAALC